MKNVWLTICMLLFLLRPPAASAGIVEGVVRDGASRAPVAWATVSLLRPDSSFVAGQATTEQGAFSFGRVARGRSDRTTGGNSETYLTAGSTGAFSNRWTRSTSRRATPR